MIYLTDDIAYLNHINDIGSRLYKYTWYFIRKDTLKLILAILCIKDPNSLTDLSVRESFIGGSSPTFQPSRAYVRIPQSNHFWPIV